MRVVQAALIAVVSAFGLAPAKTKDLGGGFLDHGVAAPNSCHRGTVATVDGEGKPIVLVWLMDHRGTYALLWIDAEKGGAREFPVPFPLGDNPFASVLSRANKFYSHFGSHFVEFDPAQRKFTFWRKTVPQMAMSMTEDDRGMIWSATYPQSGVASFDPQTGEFRDYGHVYQQDWAQYPRSVAVDDSGWVYLGVGSAACQILMFDPKTAKASPLLAEAQRRHGYGEVHAGMDGKVYGQPLAGGEDNWHCFHQGRAVKVGKRPPFRKKLIIAGSQGLFHDRFPDGRRIVTLDLIERRLVIEDPKTKQRTTLRFDYQSEGAHVMGLAAAPDGTICGGTAFPMRFFRYDPRQDQWTDREAFGQWNTVARQGDRFFAGIYGGGGLLEWNPAAPWVDTVPGRPGCNPRFLDKCEPTINRPHDLLAHPDGHTLVLAGTPGYGLTGGGLMIWDRRGERKTVLTDRQLIPDQSTMSLVALEGSRLLGGTTTSPGTGGRRKAEQAELYVFDMAQGRIEWHEPVLPGVREYTDLCLGSDGAVRGIADGTTFFVFDPAQRKLLHRQTLQAPLTRAVSHQGPRAFVRSADGTTYLLMVGGIARIDPAAWKIHLVAKSPVPVTAGGDFLDGRIYFASGSHVVSYHLTQQVKQAPN
jgi:hypothetical protein